MRPNRVTERFKAVVEDEPSGVVYGERRPYMLVPMREDLPGPFHVGVYAECNGEFAAKQLSDRGLAHKRNAAKK
jgi:hypothetical protein